MTSVDYRIACWGDSMTYGNQDGTGNTYPKYLSSDLNRPTFNYGVGGQTSAQILARQQAATNTWNWTSIIWAGKNNAIDPISDITTMVNNLGHNRYLVFSILNNNDGNQNNQVNVGSYLSILNMNNEMGSAFPNNYIDVRGLLIANANLSDPTDANDVALDQPPHSLIYTDQEHPNHLGYAIIATAAANKISQWVDIKYGSWRLR